MVYAVVSRLIWLIPCQGNKNTKQFEFGDKLHFNSYYIICHSDYQDSDCNSDNSFKTDKTHAYITCLESYPCSIRFQEIWSAYFFNDLLFHYVVFVASSYAYMKRKNELHE